MGELGERGRVLVVDDDEAIRDSVAMVLSEDGVPVVTASHGREALEWLRAHPGEQVLVLLDMMMPVMDGRAFLRHKAEDPGIAGLPVVVISAGRDLGGLLREPSVRACLPKPVSRERLLRTVVAAQNAD